MGKLEINLLGTNFTVSAQESDEYLEKLNSYYKEITSSIKNSNIYKDPLKISILAGISLIDELYKEKQKNASLRKNLSSAELEKTEEITLELIDKIDKVL